MPNDPRSRPTAPPPPRGEDSPPLTPPTTGARPRMPSVARMALGAPPVEVSSEDRILRAIAQTEQAMHREADERALAFESSLKAQIRAIVTTEVKHSTPPPPPLPPEKSMWAHIGPHLPASIAAVGAVLIALSQNCSGASKAIAERQDKLEKRQDTSDARALERATQQHDYDIHARWWAQDVLEKLDVKIDDPLGAPDRPQSSRLEFWPVPVPDPHKVAKGIAAPRVQPKTPFPLPPPIPDPK